MKTTKLILGLATTLFITIACENSKKIQQTQYHPSTQKAVSQPETIALEEVKNEIPVSKKTKNETKTPKPASKKSVRKVEPIIEAAEPVRGNHDVYVVEHEIKQQIYIPTNNNDYDVIEDNSYYLALQNPLSTFSIDVDNASYSIVRQYIMNGSLPPANAVRIEELINYFDYGYQQPDGEHPFSIYTEVAQAPWNDKHQIVMIGIKGKDLDYDNLRPSNLVFLIDTSGSMGDKNKLPLLIKSFEILVNNLPDNSKVAIVTYAGSAGLVLPATKIKHKEKILNALKNLHAGGSTAGGAGIKLAYKIAEEQFISNGNNRVILATDGDFNVGTHSKAEMVSLIKDMKKKNIYLSILGFGMGNYKDNMMEQISNAGNGNYFYIDNYSEALKVFKKELVANMFTIAKDVKIQVEFNPVNVKAYRLIGYANRKLDNKDFNDDTKDAGELGAGHTVTALYEIIPAGSNEVVPGTDELKYQKILLGGKSDELLTVKLRYKPIKSNKSKLIKIPVLKQNKNCQQANDDFKLACSVAGFGMLLRNSEYKGKTNIQLLKKLVTGNKDYKDMYKNEYITLLDKFETLSTSNTLNY